MFKSVGLFAAAFLATAALAATSPKTFTANPVTTYTDGTTIPAGVIVTYNVYGGECGTTLRQLNGGLTSPRVVRTPTDGRLNCYYMTAVAGGQESGPSNVVEVDTRNVAPPPPPVLKPAAPTGFQFVPYTK
jgi:hypothetical protein